MEVGTSHGNGLFFRTLTEKQAREIHHASCQILEETGMVIHHAEAVDLLRLAGAKVENGNRVYFPTYLVQQALQSAPSRVTVYNRDGCSGCRWERSLTSEATVYALHRADLSAPASEGVGGQIIDSRSKWGSNKFCLWRCRRSHCSRYRGCCFSSSQR